MEIEMVVVYNRPSGSYVLHDETVCNIMLYVSGVVDSLQCAKGTQRTGPVASFKERIVQ